MRPRCYNNRHKHKQQHDNQITLQIYVISTRHVCFAFHGRNTEERYWKRQSDKSQSQFHAFSVANSIAGKDEKRRRRNRYSPLSDRAEYYYYYGLLIVHYYDVGALAQPHPPLTSTSYIICEHFLVRCMFSSLFQAVSIMFKIG